MLKPIAAIACLAALAGCSAPYGGPVFISGNSPGAAQARNAELEPPNSLPPGFQGIGPGPNATRPDYGSIRMPLGG